MKNTPRRLGSDDLEIFDNSNLLESAREKAKTKVQHRNYENKVELKMSKIPIKPFITKNVQFNLSNS